MVRTVWETVPTSKMERFLPESVRECRLLDVGKDTSGVEKMLEGLFGGILNYSLFVVALETIEKYSLSPVTLGSETLDILTK